MARKSTRPTLKTISELTGLAVPTVSRALSGAEDIGKETRARVKKAAEEVGYIPNRAGVRLRTGRSYVITLMLSTESDVMNLTARLINSVATGLRDTRYNLTITPVFPDEDPILPLVKMVETQGADAVILNQIQPEDPRIKYLMRTQFPFVTHGRSKWSDQHDFYDFDNRAFGQTAVSRLVDKGCRSIWLLAPPITQTYSQEMIAGASEAAFNAKIPLKVLDTVNSDAPPDEIRVNVGALLANGPIPEGVICASSASCMSTVSALEDAGLTIGQNVEVLSKEAIPFLGRFRPNIMTQFEDAWAAGIFLAQAAINRIENAGSPHLQCLEHPQREEPINRP